MRLKNLELNGFKSFAKKTVLEFGHPVVSIVGPNGSGKSNVVEAFRFVLGEQSIKSMRSKSGADLIFKGSKHLSKGSSAKVTIYLDNSDRVFKLFSDSEAEMNLNYDTVTIAREVFSDGLNKYSLNGSEVRLRDIASLLSSVHIGASGHHIISQGEADRILNANSKERREMIEDALGLKVYQYKIKESEKKLEKVSTNMKEVGMLRRENAPHLNFLRKQMEKFEKMKEMKVELLSLYHEYLSKEGVYLENEKSTLGDEKKRLQSEIASIAIGIKDNTEASSAEENKKLRELKDLENKIANIRRIKGEMERKLGRIEGMIEMESYRAESVPEAVALSAEEVNAIVEEINESLEEAIHTEEIAVIHEYLYRIKKTLEKFNKNTHKTMESTASLKVADLKNTQREIQSEMAQIEKEENLLAESIATLKEEINREIEAGRDLEREKFTLRVRHQELTSQLNINSVREENLHREIGNFDNEVREGVALIGDDVRDYKNYQIEGAIDKMAQEQLHKSIERIKIKLEDGGLGSSAEVMREYQEVSERDAFLEKEMEDLMRGVESLEKLMVDLKEKIDIEFKHGIKKINVEFQEFFALMFGGGYGSLSVVVENKKQKISKDMDESAYAEGYGETQEEIAFEEGIEINVSLPHKKVKELQSLSGGERSLTSIALLFAMSQVNPPPFLILDETDAALDEANSRKYGDMIERLSKHSQLIVVTHNRETMSRAGVLYGVTIGADGASKLLSVKFEEAVAIAK